MQRFRGGLVFEAHRLFGSLNSRLDSNKEDEEDGSGQGLSPSVLDDVFQMPNMLKPVRGNTSASSIFR